MEAASKQTVELQGAISGDTAHYVRSSTTKTSTSKLPSRQLQIVKKPCHRCGGKHSPYDCKLKEQQCNNCGRYGHIAKVCLSTSSHNAHRSAHKPTRKVQYVDDTALDNADNNDDLCLLNINSKSGDNKIIIPPVINGTSTAMEVDTGATRMVISADTWRLLGSLTLNSCGLTLKT